MLATWKPPTATGRVALFYTLSTDATRSWTGLATVLHDRHAKIVSISAKNIQADGIKHRQEPPRTGGASVVAEVANVDWPTLLDPVDDLPPATIVASVSYEQGKLVVTGVTHDNSTIASATVIG